MQNSTNPYDSLDFRVDLPLEECLQRLEDYRKQPLRSREPKKVFINIEPVKKDEIYRVVLGYYLLSQTVKLEADGDGCLITGQVHYNRLIPPMIALFTFFCILMQIPLQFDMGLFVLSILSGGAFLLYWLIKMGIAGEFKLTLSEILNADSEFVSDSNRE